ncbi:hypothetical protein DTO164E3_6567 [Paecilomyces variotii]|nr:hypothetical protein DTO164E3_6567 [Paecilomyces variotii]KAJ9197485.1 hypothetical protein DTO032I3_5967 [Paecilomyces variotii]KAJ9222787.1 hypothetical protein DTO169C6_4802 [Paecilomyces variotii]KAJ9275210.1 hypothetical protein DTO021D3_7968 [Paecilomyces variotii]KAJ9312176.1 hypothetical protein DTO271D3_7618 [Paecilomyces variotii]
MTAVDRDRVDGGPSSHAVDQTKRSIARSHKTKTKKSESGPASTSRFTAETSPHPVSALLCSALLYSLVPSSSTHDLLSSLPFFVSLSFSLYLSISLSLYLSLSIPRSFLPVTPTPPSRFRRLPPALVRDRRSSNASALKSRYQCRQVGGRYIRKGNKQQAFTGGSSLAQNTLVIVLFDDTT